MKVLLTGILPYSIWTIAERLARGGDQVAVMGYYDETANIPKSVSYYDIHPNHHEALKMLEAAHYEAIVFFYAYQCEESQEYGSVQGVMLDALFAMLGAVGHCGVEKFILVTDQRVFGANQMALETETPLPDTPTGVLIKAAEDCFFCGAPDTVHPLLVRVTSLYEPQDPHSIFSHALKCAHSGTPMILSGSQDTPCDFLHADDLALFLSLALGNNLSGVAHLSYGKSISYGEAAQLLMDRIPNLSVKYSNEIKRTHVLSGTAAQTIAWIPRHDFSRELDQLCAGAAFGNNGNAKADESGIRQLIKQMVPIVELIALACAAIFLTHQSQNNAVLSTMDYMLLFVAIMGTVHGCTMGIAASLIACVHYAADWVLGGNDLYLLLYNADHWLPLCCYMLCGSLFGYLRDKLSAQIDTQKREMDELSAQNEFLKTLYHQVDENRNHLQEQVMRTRDSYGRIYHITRELDTLQPEQVFLSTLDVLEDTLQNHSVALYECNPGGVFARLVVQSRSMKQIARSLNLNQYPAMVECLSQGKLFDNTSLNPDYPTYAAPVMNDGELKAILVLWNVPFEKQTQYYENLFSVVAGLVQSALVRALHHLSLAADEYYITGTHILTDRAFRSALGVYQTIRKRRTGQFLLVQVVSDKKLTPQQYDEQIGRSVRATDLIGRMNDDGYYVLFPQASIENLPQISARFQAHGLACKVVSQEAVYAG